MTRRLRVAATLLAFAVLPAAAQTPAPASPPPGLAGPLVLAKQGSFFVGGRTIKSDTLSTLPAYAPSGTITVEQMYVRYQVPVEARRPPVTLIHGCCLTGKTWETTPDGRMGWDEYFVRRGHPTYVIDQVSRGRSSADPSLVNSVRLGKTPPDKTPPIFAAGQEAAWAIFRFGTEYPQVHPGMRFPLAAKDEFYKQMVVDWIATMPTPNPTVTALSQLAKQLDGTVLISHSQSGIYPFQTAALDTRGIAAIVSIEPGTCPSATGDLKPYLGIPIMVLWGDYVETSSRWAPRLKACRAFAEALTKAGGRIDHVVLPEIGIKGNSHMLMQDDNSLEIADRLVAWIEKTVAAKKN
ncbi:esterase [Rhodoplanes sp. TEM]|uniref:Esterase n=1 Tax=Rhodoplanes tepidamans TaxID=200616 RepID=A0ABT5J961_RHOTP|nr:MULTISPECIES: esterase [Rhodoplanes]MDC7786193.1 esterase [Rhodoplanes tepidamans]MDC7982860.1 esterase [Rhodoplanes sp. TEM]MDQ0357141.1 pimeloyl-ACP methyl ester carboxylesterase [Rhodoplanes tepidamans]